MSKVEHTPGPWEYGDYNELRADRPNDDDCILIASICDAPLGLDWNGSRVRPHVTGEANANARLIAAAPELLAALQLAHDLLTCHEIDGLARKARVKGFVPDVRMISTVLAKARGDA